MKIEIWPQYGPLNSKDIFKKFINSLENNNEQLFVNQETDADVAVIWSVLWSGRMSGYRPIWNRYTNKNKAVVVMEVGGIKRNETFKIAIEELEKSRIPVGEVLKAEETLREDHILKKGSFVKMKYPTLDQEYSVVGPAVDLSENPGQIKKRSPQLGEHNLEILSGLGYSREEIEKLKEERII